MVCGVLLRHLDLGKEVAWCESLKRIRSIVGGVDYKVLSIDDSCAFTQGCRDMMKLLLIVLCLHTGVPRYDEIVIDCVVPSHRGAEI